VQFAAAILKPPHLVTMIPNIAPAMPFGNMPYEGGVLVMGGDIRWIDIVENAKTAADMGKKVQEVFTRDWDSLLNYLPVIDLDKKILGKENSYWRKWIQHNSDDSYWVKVNYLEQLKELNIPVFLQSGWYDGGNRGTKLAYSALKQSKNKNIKMIMGPWVHSDQASRYLYGQDMGEAAAIDLMDIYKRWFDFWLKDEDNGILKEPLVQVFDMGPNNWLEADTYPLPNTSFTKFYLTSENGANTSQGDGQLQLQEPSSKKQFDSYTYDPGDPSPCFYAHLKKRASEQYNNLVASRKDILVYQTAPFDQPLTIAGPVSAVLYASSSAKDTDWCVTVYGIAESGDIYPIGMTWGVLRARFRNSMHTPELLKKDEIYKYNIDLSHTGITFTKGERIRLEISSASFPEYSRNLNTGGHNEMETEYVTANQRLYHTIRYPSHLLLPVFKGEKKGTNNDSRINSKDVKKSIDTTPDKLKKYIGNYYSANRDLIVTAKNGNLVVEIPGRAVLPLKKPDENGSWYCKIAPAIYFTFKENIDGRVTEIHLHQIINMQKKSTAVESNKNIPDEFKPYLGTYSFAAANLNVKVFYMDSTLAIDDPTENTVIKLYTTGEKDRWIDQYNKNSIFFSFDDSSNVKSLRIDAVDKFNRGKLAAKIIEEVINSSGIEEGIKKYEELNQDVTNEYVFTEQSINALGYKLLNNEKIPAALEIFRLNAIAYPNSWNVYDSLGEAYMKNENKELAIKNYQKSLGLNPGNENGKKMLERLNKVK